MKEKKLSLNQNRFNLYIKEWQLAKKCHTDLSDKMNWLSQLRCHICDPDFPICIIPIRIEPESYQVLDKIDRDAFKRAIQSSMHASHLGHFQDGKICLHILFVCGSKRRTKDLDNMAKLLIDSIKDLIMGDDKHIDYLNIVRLSHEFEEECIFIRISNSNLNSHCDVAAKEFHHIWDGRNPLILSDFYATA